MRQDQRSDAAKVYRKLYNTAQWRRTRRQQLADHPLCQRCLPKGFIIAATVCNHVDPKTKLDPATFFDGPFSSLCAPCHDQAVQSEERGGNLQADRIGYSGAVDADGWPTDPRHPVHRATRQASAKR